MDPLVGKIDEVDQHLHRFHILDWSPLRMERDRKQSRGSSCENLHLLSLDTESLRRSSTTLLLLQSTSRGEAAPTKPEQNSQNPADSQRSSPATAEPR